MTDARASLDRARPVVIAGPTGAGKSGLALALAERERGAIVCADSRQLYVGMQVGAAGPDDKERARAPHVGYAAFPPEEVYDAGRFIEDTDRHVDEARKRGELPILVGGSGMYLRCWRYGLDDVPGGDPAVRDALERRRAEEGLGALFEELQRVDAESASKFGPNDPVRIVRALEVFMVTGEPASARKTSHFAREPRREATWLLLEPSLEWLTPRLAARAKRMFDEGLVEEALALRDRLGHGHRLLETMGYEEALAFADGRLRREEALSLTVQRQRQFARRQRTWFRKEPWWHRVDPADSAVLEAEVRGLLST